VSSGIAKRLNYYGIGSGRGFDSGPIKKIALFPNSVGLGPVGKLVRLAAGTGAEPRGGDTVKLRSGAR
jgi:hypothetical protein